VPAVRRPTWLMRCCSLRWRAGIEARIGTLKHRFNMVRACYKGDIGFKRHVGWSIIANSLVSIARVQRQRKESSCRGSQTSSLTIAISYCPRPADSLPWSSWAKLRRPIERAATPVVAAAEGPKRGPHMYISFRGDAGKTTGYYVPKAAQEEILAGIQAWQTLKGYSVAAQYPCCQTHCWPSQAQCGAAIHAHPGYCGVTHQGEAIHTQPASAQPQ
jgi:hypothetical protein